MATSEPDRSIVSEVQRAPIGAPAQRALSVAWALVVALGGGAACGWCIDEFGTVGAFSLWPLGAVAGFAAARLKLSGRFCARALVAACLVAFVIAETYWIRLNETEGWWDAVCYWPTFITKYELSAILGMVLAAFGAESAFRQTRRANRAVL